MSGFSKFVPSKGREIQDITNKINELITAINSLQNTQGGTNQDKTFYLDKKDNGQFALRVKMKDGTIESDNTSATGFKIV